MIADGYAAKLRMQVPFMATRGRSSLICECHDKQLPKKPVSWLYVCLIAALPPLWVRCSLAEGYVCRQDPGGSLCAGWRSPEPSGSF